MVGEEYKKLKTNMPTGNN